MSATKQTRTSKATSKASTPVQAAPAAPAAPATQAARPVANLRIQANPAATNTARPGTKRHAWIAAILAAKDVQAALAAPLPQGVEPLGMGQINWCARAKLITLLPPAAQ